MVRRTSTAPVLVCDLGGTWLRVALVDGEGSVGDKEVIPTPLDDPAALVRTMRSVAARAKKPIAGAVIGVPGLVDYSRGEVLVIPNIPEWEGTLSAARLSADLGISVLLANDADFLLTTDKRRQARDRRGVELRIGTACFDYSVQLNWLRNPLQRTRSQPFQLEKARHVTTCGMRDENRIGLRFRLNPRRQVGRFPKGQEFSVLVVTGFAHHGNTRMDTDTHLKAMTIELT